MGRDHETPDSASREASFQRADDAREEQDFGGEALSCADALELIPAYLDEELSEPRAAPLRRHLIECHACREQAQAERALQRWFVPEEPVAVPAGFAARVTQLAFSGARSADPRLLERQLPAARSSAGPAPAADAAPESQRLRSFVLAAVAIAAAVLLTFAVALHLRNRPSSEDLQADELPALWVPGTSVPQPPRRPAAVPGTTATLPGTIQTGATQSGATRSGATRSGAAQTGTIQSGATQSGAAQAGATQSGATATLQAQPSVRAASAASSGSKPSDSPADPTGLQPTGGTGSKP
jgi:hypothetical protein